MYCPFCLEREYFFFSSTERRFIMSELERMSPQQLAFVDSLTTVEKEYLWGHILRYAGIEGSTKEEQFGQIIMYVLNFFNEDDDMHQRIYAKALQMFT